jgi:hypothetical protein
MSKVLVLASGRSAKQANDYDYKENGWTIVAVNNGWLAAPNDWNHWVHSNDFRGQRPTIKNGQVECKKYIHILKHYGGHDKCGFSITLCGGYYGLYTFNPSVIGFLGADMNYKPDDNGNTHFYGVGYDIATRGVSDPDRMVAKYGNESEDYISQIYTRFADVAKENGCQHVVNFSNEVDTRLPYPKATPNEF